MHSTSSAGGLLFGLLTRSSEDENARPDDDEDPPALRDDAFPLRCEFVVAGRVSCPYPPRGGQVADSGGRLIELTTESGCGRPRRSVTLWFGCSSVLHFALFTLRFSTQPSSPQVRICGPLTRSFHPVVPIGLLLDLDVADDALSARRRAALRAGARPHVRRRLDDGHARRARQARAAQRRRRLLRRRLDRDQCR
eukprot:scaffold88316_cov55-Phaeocystis_antarctica.AAC.2